MRPDPIDDGPRHAALTARIAAFHVHPCAMAHERVTFGPGGLPVRDDRAESGYRRPGLCAAALRASDLGCSHTTARIALDQALDSLGEETRTLRDALRAIGERLGPLDHRRYDAERRRADAVRAGDAEEAAKAEAEIGATVAEHRALGLRAGEIRDAALLMLGAAETPGPMEGRTACTPAPLAQP